VTKPYLHSKWFVTLQILIILALGVAASWYLAGVVFDKEKEALVLRVSNAAAVFDPEIVESLQGASSDIDNPSYNYLKRKLVDLKSINSDARFVYLMGYRQDINKLFFYADSESPKNTESYSPPGQVYDESTPLEINNFLNGVAFAEGPYKDSWGSWVSAYAPLYSRETGLPVAIIGIDVNASKIILDVLYATSLPFILAVFLAIIFFISHRMKKREKLNELNNIKMEFTSFMSHEIRGYVTKVKGGMRSLQDEELGALSDDQKVFLHDMIQQTDDFSDLVEEFLDIGRIEQDSEITLSKTDANIMDIVKGVVSDARELLSKKSVTVVYEGNIPERIYSNCDSNKIARVFSNVLTNSIKYSPEKSTVHIGYIDSNLSHTIYIKDEGIGIPDEEKNNVFKKFFRASNARDSHLNGTGLGLYFSKLIVEKHDGKIWFESSSGRGTTFFISLPKS